MSRLAGSIVGTLLRSVSLLVTASVGDLHAQTVPAFGATLEGAVVWSARNDVRIPPDTGTEFSIVDLIGAAPTASVRTELTWDFADRHGLRVVYAPLQVAGRGVLSGPVTFAGTEFAPGPATAEYQFSSWRATYRYRVHDGGTWRWDIGFTGFVRDARVALAQSGMAAEDTDVGFVPLGHVRGRARLGPEWSVVLDVDGAAAPPGRAFDVSAVLEYAPTPRWAVAAGYRTIEGGADVEKVFTFAWLNAVVVRAGVRF